jgi:hypothetical protein
LDSTSTDASVNEVAGDGIFRSAHPSGPAKDSAVGTLDKVRQDLQDATEHVKSAWPAADDARRLELVTYGLEAMLRAVSSLSLVVEQEQQYRRVLSGRLNGLEWAHT